MLWVVGLSLVVLLFVWCPEIGSDILEALIDALGDD